MPIIPTLRRQPELREQKVFNPPNTTPDDFGAEGFRQVGRSGQQAGQMISTISSVVTRNIQKNEYDSAQKAIAQRETSLSADWDHIQSLQGDEAENAATVAAERARKWKDDPKSPYASLSALGREYFDKQDLDLHTRQINNAATFAMRSKQVNRQVAAEASADAAHLYLQNSPDPRDATLMDKAATAHALALSKGRVTMVPDADGNVTPTYASEADSQAFETAKQSYKVDHRTKLAASTIDRLNAADPEDIKTVTFLRSQYEQDIKDMPETVRAQLNEAYARAGQSMEHRLKAKAYDRSLAAKATQDAEEYRLKRLEQDWMAGGFKNTEALIQELGRSPHAEAAVPIMQKARDLQEKLAEAATKKADKSTEEKTKAERRQYITVLTLGKGLDEDGKPKYLTSADIRESSAALFRQGKIEDVDFYKSQKLAKDLENDLARRFHEEAVNQIMPTFQDAIKLGDEGFTRNQEVDSKGRPKYPFDKDTKLRDTDTVTGKRQAILLQQTVEYMNAIRSRLASDPKYTLEQAKQDFREATLETTEEAKKLTILQQIEKTRAAAQFEADKETKRIYTN